MNHTSKLLSCLALLALVRFVNGQTDRSQSSAVHLKQEKEWAAREQTTPEVIGRIIRAAGLGSNDDFTIENLNLTGLRSRRQVLLSTWELGTGHRLTVYVLQAVRGVSYKRVFEADRISEHQNFCSQSMLGAAHAYISSRVVVVQMPVDTRTDADDAVRASPTIELLCSKFSWTGKEYKLAETATTTVPKEKYHIKSELCSH